MKYLFTILLVSFSALCFAQTLVEFKLGANKQETINYLQSLITLENCNTCGVKSGIDSSGGLTISLDLPLSDKEVKATFIVAFFQYSTTPDKDFCVEFRIVCNRKYLISYLDKIRQVCTHNASGDWERDTGVQDGGKKVFIIYHFANMDDDYFRIDAYFEKRG